MAAEVIDGHRLERALGEADLLSDHLAVVREEGGDVFYPSWEELRAEDREEMLRLYRELEDPKFPNIMLQELIPGDDDQVWIFNGFFDDKSHFDVGRQPGQTARDPEPDGAAPRRALVDDHVERRSLRACRRPVREAYAGLVP